MRLRSLHSMTACLVTASALVIAGCSSYPGNGSTPIGYRPGTPQYGYPQPGYLPVSNPGGGPPIIWVPNGPVPAPRQPIPINPIPVNPQPPEKPVVLKPVPPIPDPGGNPGGNSGGNSGGTTPVSQPKPIPPTPTDITAKWAPWQLPPRGAAIAANPNVPNQVAAAQAVNGMPHTACLHPQGTAAQKFQASANSAPDSERRVDGTNSSPEQDLRWRGGKILQNMSYVNLYLGGEAAGWTLDEVSKIDASLEAALTDINLNHVLMQYFDNQPLGTTALPSHPLMGTTPQIVSRGDVQRYMQYFFDQGYLNSYPLDSTIFNFLLPPGTILNDEDQPGNNAKGPASLAAETEDEGRKRYAPADEAGDSTGGLGGYHGSIHYHGKTLYYSVEVYSERRADGFANGIPVFPESWKNVCATMYHEICEFRTDPDVEDAIRDPYNPNSEQFLGWTSDSGEEIGDYPLHAGASLKSVVTEVPLANGKGTVPVQYNYSNAVHGPEGPIPGLNPVAPR